MAQMTFYPDAHPESTSVDGWTYDEQANSTWANLIALPGSQSESEGGGDYALLRLAEFTRAIVENRWNTLYRCALLFDLSLQGILTVTAANLIVYGHYKVDPLSITPDLCVYSSSPASNTDLVAGDFDSYGSTPYSNVITYANFVDGGDNTFTLNGTALAAINTAIAGDGMR